MGRCSKACVFADPGWLDTFNYSSEKAILDQLTINPCLIWSSHEHCLVYREVCGRQSCLSSPCTAVNIWMRSDNPGSSDRMRSSDCMTCCMWSLKQLDLIYGVRSEIQNRKKKKKVIHECQREDDSCWGDKTNRWRYFLVHRWVHQHATVSPYKDELSALLL